MDLDLFGEEALRKAETEWIVLMANVQKAMEQDLYLLEESSCLGFQLARIREVKTEVLNEELPGGVRLKFLLIYGHKYIQVIKQLEKILSRYSKRLESFQG